MSIELPKDAEGREIPLDTEVLYDECGTKVSVKEFLSRTLVESQKNSWTIKAQYEGNFYYNSFKPKNMHLTLPDTWEKLEEDLRRGADALNYEACAYLGKSACDCSSCIADKGATCERVVMRDIASRIRKLRGEGE
ncbi:hypothetical protein DW925_05740 [Collinsella sp. AM43-1]|jgi:hypothetical protein|uniref:hypothetical protein n=1 Tax=Collinsella sp. AM43-1 TaxID=2292322 RepID=UPI000E4A3736|nr:hypothetical protein [Collinsella sp. AM43-1]RHA69489.1 hypothetical protein DW925_05740 [Collinsella sp. AM43-1]